VSGKIVKLPEQFHFCSSQSIFDTLSPCPNSKYIQNIGKEFKN